MRLYVGNVPFQAGEDDIRDFFSHAGVAVDSVNLVRDKFSGESRGFAFVDVQDPAMAEAAIRLGNGKSLLGRKLVINEARPVSENAPRRGGPGGGGGGQRERWR